jgi:hypothetical protein
MPHGIDQMVEHADVEQDFACWGATWRRLFDIPKSDVSADVEAPAPDDCLDDVLRPRVDRRHESPELSEPDGMQSLEASDLEHSLAAESQHPVETNDPLIRDDLGAVPLRGTAEAASAKVLDECVPRQKVVERFELGVGQTVDSFDFHGGCRVSPGRI